MPSVTVTLHGMLNRELPGGGRTVQAELRDASTIGQLLAVMGVPIETLWMLYLNGESVLLDAVLSEGDRLEVFPIVCGGEPAAW